MSKITMIIIKVAEFIGIMFLGVSLAVFFEYGIYPCSILLVESIALIALSKFRAHQANGYECRVQYYQSTD